MTAAKLKVLRVQAGLTLEELASRAGLTRSYVSKVERGLATPSIRAALNIAGVLDVTVEALFGTDAPADTVAIVRGASPPGALGNGAMQLVAGHLPNRKLLAFVLVPPLQGVEGNPSSHHEGEELVYVLEGSVELHLAGRKEVLAAGDCAHFESTIPHRISSLGNEAAKVLLVISPTAQVNATDADSSQNGKTMGVGMQSLQ